MLLKPIIITGAILLAASAFAQSAEKQAPNFILGHGALQPQAPSTDYPPGHQLEGRNASLPTGNSERAKPEARSERR